MSTHIELINYVNVCSDAFLQFIDTELDKHFFDSDHITIDVSINRIKHAITYNVNEIINKKIKKFGSTYIMFNTCRMSDNWRHQFQNVNLGAKYKLCDDSIIINLYKLEQIFDEIWNKFIKNQVIITIDFKHIDSIDTEHLIKQIIGTRYTLIEYPKYRLIIDSNINYERALSKDIPDYLRSEVEMELRVKNIIT